MIPASDLGISAASYFASQLPDLKKSSGRAMVRCCFHNERSGSLQVDLDTGRFKCFGCGAGGDIVDFHGKLHGLDFKKAYSDLGGQAFSNRKQIEQAARNKHHRTQAPLTLWQVAKSLNPGDVVDFYLRSRGLCLGVFPECLRLVPALEYTDEGQTMGAFPCLLARVDDSEGEPIGLHRTYLTETGAKADVRSTKKMLGRTGGGAVRLFSANESVALAEGIETALAFHILSGLPVWACLSTSGLITADIPKTVQKVIIAGDNDKNGAGQVAANKLAYRLDVEGRQTKVYIPPVEGDWLDFLQMKNKEKI